MGISALATDLYELTMMAGYDSGHRGTRATFELSVPRLSPHRAFLVSAGLEQAVDYLEHLHFAADEIAWLRTLPNLRGVPATFFDDTLASLRFTGDLWAVPEGTPIFAQEPILRVSAPIAEAQLVETALLAILTFQTTIASKAARVVRAAEGRAIMEFGSRRAHGLQAALHAARAAWLAGCASTSNVEAGYRFGIPLSGTMAHSWVGSFEDEVEAFARYAKIYGDQSVFLIDTYDSIAAARKIVAAGLRPAAVRLDSGDLLAVSREVRQVLDEGGLSRTRILASGDLDEWAIADLVARGAPIDGFGVGTALSTSSDAPALGGIYKLVELERAGRRTPVMKLSGGKTSLPGTKQVWRQMDGPRAVRDTIGLVEEPAPPGSRPLLGQVMRGGRRVGTLPTLDAVRASHARAVAELPDALRALDAATAYEVVPSPGLEDLRTVMQEKLSA